MRTLALHAATALFGAILALGAMRAWPYPYFCRLGPCDIVVNGLGFYQAGAVIAQPGAPAEAGGFHIGTRGHLISPASGLMRWQNTKDTHGVEINVGIESPKACHGAVLDLGSTNAAGLLIAGDAEACALTFGAPAWSAPPVCVVGLASRASSLPYVAEWSPAQIVIRGLSPSVRVAYHCLANPLPPQ